MFALSDENFRFTKGRSILFNHLIDMRTTINLFISCRKNVFLLESDASTLTSIAAFLRIKGSPFKKEYYQDGYVDSDEYHDFPINSCGEHEYYSSWDKINEEKIG